MKTWSFNKCSSDVLLENQGPTIGQCLYLTISRLIRNMQVSLGIAENEQRDLIFYKPAPDAEGRKDVPTY